LAQGREEERKRKRSLMSSLPIRDVTALNITNAVLGLSVLSICVVVVVQAIREGIRSLRRHAAQVHPPAMHGKHG
jgi:hypothetical protein